MKTICPKCGTLIEEKNNFCTNCGTQISSFNWKKICLIVSGISSVVGVMELCLMSIISFAALDNGSERLVMLLIICVPVLLLVVTLIWNMILFEKEKKKIKKVLEKFEETQTSYIKLKESMTDEHGEAINISEHLKQLKEELSKFKEQTRKEKTQLNKELSRKKGEIQTLNNKIKELNSEIIELDEIRLLQSFGLYEPKYNLASSEEYKQRLNDVREKQKDMVKYGDAAVCTTNWTVDNSEVKGRKMTNNNIKQILRCFNCECEATINKVTYRNYSSKKNRIETSFRVLNRMNQSNVIHITDEYLELKLEELDLAYEYEVKKQEEKEEARQKRELEREEEKLRKELESKREELEKEQAHYTLAKERLMEQIEGTSDEERKNILKERLKEIEANLIDVDKAMQDLDYREANMRAGYIYVISNIGSFGNDVYKIGMTRRLEPMDRINELGDASVPFKFDVHALIFSDDAPALETAIHRELEDKKVNCMNNRKEFFKVSLKEIEAIVKRNYDKTVKFNYIPEAQQYRESQKMREKNRGA